MTAAWLFVLLCLPARAAVVRAPLGEIPGLGGAAAVYAPSFVPVLPSYLSVANPADGLLLADIVRAAQASPTAMAVLAQIEQTAAKRRRPIAVEIVAMKESGAYNLDTGVLSLRRRDMAEGPRANVSTIIHELQHLLQSGRTLPSDLLETELEAYVVDFRVSREMNDKPPRGSYDARAQAAFKRGLEPFMGFLRREYPEDAQLHKTRSKDYESRLRGELAASESRRAELAVERAERVRVLEQMRALGHAPSELGAYERDSIGPLDAALDALDRAIDWARKDIAILADPQTRAKARAYARSVVRRARAYQKIFARD